MNDAYAMLSCLPMFAFLFGGILIGRQIRLNGTHRWWLYSAEALFMALFVSIVAGSIAARSVLIMLAGVYGVMLTFGFFHGLFAGFFYSAPAKSVRRISFRQAWRPGLN